MAVIAGIRDFLPFGIRGSDKPESVRTDILIRDCLLDLRHMTVHALTSRTAGFVMCVGFDTCGMRTVLRIGAMAGQTYFLHWFPQRCIILAAMRIVTAEAGHSARIHQALNKIISLHAILVGGAVGKMRKGQFAEFVLFEIPEIGELETHVESDRPVVIAAVNLLVHRSAL